MSHANPHACTLPPPGWYCTRPNGHPGPCAAHPVDPSKALPMEPAGDSPRWKDDCQGKADYDGVLARVSSRYWPGNYRQDGKPSAESAIIYGDQAVRREFVGNTEHEVKSAVEDWVRTTAAPRLFNFAAHLERQRAWSEKTFGPGPRAAGILDHLRKELLEIEADPTDLSEWIDVVILALDGAWRMGADVEEIIDTLAGKQARNEARVWPDWRTMPADQAIEHDRSQEPGA